MRSNPKSTLLFWFKFACCCAAKHRELNKAFTLPSIGWHCFWRRINSLLVTKATSIQRFSDNASAWFNSIAKLSTKFISHAPKQISGRPSRRTVTYWFCDFPRGWVNGKYKSQLSLSITTSRHLLATDQKSWSLIVNKVLQYCDQQGYGHWLVPYVRNSILKFICG